MGSWQVPNKVLLPAEADLSPSVFEFNGRLANGDQVMAYVGSGPGTRARPPRPSRGTRPSCSASTRTGPSWPATSPRRRRRGFYREGPGAGLPRGRELLFGLVDKVRVEGWASADILVRPFYVMVDDLETGLLYQTAGEDESEAEEDFGDYSPECLTLVPFDRIFRRPWTTGEYDT